MRKGGWPKGKTRGPHTVEHRAKISKAHIGKKLGKKRAPFTDETRAKMSAGRRANIAARAVASAMAGAEGVA